MSTIIDGDGIVTAGGTSTSQGRVRLAEDTDNGTNYVELQAAANIASNVTFTLPSADGTSGQVLQTNGSGTLSFATPAGGSWVYLSTVSASGVATADVETTFDSTYDAYAIVLTNVVLATDGTSLRARLKVNGSYQTANYDYHVAKTATGATTYDAAAASAAAQILFSAAVNMNASSIASSTSNYVVYLHNPASTTKTKNMYWTGFFTNTLGNLISNYGAASYTGGTEALTGVRWYSSSGNISGTFRLYGIKNS